MNQLFGLLIMYLTASVGPGDGAPGPADVSESLPQAEVAEPREATLITLEPGDNPVSLAADTPQRFNLMVSESGLYRIETVDLPGDVDTLLARLDPATGQILEEDDDGGQGYASLLMARLSADAPNLFQVSELGGLPGDFVVRVSLSRAQQLRMGSNPITLAAGTSRFLELRPEQSGFYQIETTNLSEEVDTVLSLHDAATGEMIQEDDDGGEGYASLLSVRAVAGETYLIQVRDLNDSAGDFTIQVSTSSADTLALGDTPITLAANAPKMLELQLSEPGFYQIETVELAEGVDTLLARIDPASGEVMEEDDDGGLGYASRLSLWVSGAETYLFRVSELNAEAAQFTVRVSNPEIQTFQPGNNPVTLEGGAAQFFELDLPEAGIYQLGVVGLHSGVDPVLRRYDTDTGGIIQEDDDSGEGYAPSLYVQGTGTDTILMQVADFNESPATFKVSIVDLGEPMLLFAGESLSEQSIAAGGSRWYQLDASSGGTSMQGYSISTHDLTDNLDTTLQFFDENFQMVGFDDDGGQEALGSLLSWAGTSGVFLRVQNIATVDGSFSLSVTTPTIDDLPTGVKSNLNLPVDGRLVYRMPSQAGQYYSISTANLTNGVDTVLRILDSSASMVLAEDDDGGGDLASRLEWSADSDGEYWLEIVNISASGGSFELRVATSP